MPVKNSTEESRLPSGFERVHCPLCGGSNFRTLLKTHDYLFGAPGEFTISRCRGCSLVMQNPRPGREMIADYYPDDYEPHKMAKTKSAIDEMTSSQEGRRKLLEQYVQGGHALDIGSGDGRFLLCLKKAGWDVSGCELIESMAEFQKNELGLDVKTGDLLFADFPASHFDAATLWSVFEHLFDPLDTLKEISRILKPGGTLIIGVPNFNSFERIIFGERWFSLQPPYHLFHFTPKTIGLLVDKAGLEMKKVQFATTVTGIINSTKLIMSRNRQVHGEPTPEHKAREVQENTGSSDRKKLKTLLFNLVAVPALRTLDLLHLGGTTNYIIRKPD